MRLTIGDVFEIVSAIDELKDNKIPFDLACRLVLVKDKLASLYTLYHEKKVALVLDYAIKDDDGQVVYTEEGQVRIHKDKQLDLQKELFNFLKTEVDIDITPIPKREFDTLVTTFDHVYKMRKIIDLQSK